MTPTNKLEEQTQQRSCTTTCTISFFVVESIIFFFLTKSQQEIHRTTINNLSTPILHNLHNMNLLLHQGSPPVRNSFLMLFFWYLLMTPLWGGCLSCLFLQTPSSSMFVTALNFTDVIGNHNNHMGSQQQQQHRHGCQSCWEDMTTVQTCIQENNCNIRQCRKDARQNDIPFHEILGPCCSPCNELLIETRSCLKDCLPDCIKVTTKRYIRCSTLIPRFDCQTLCQEQLQQQQQGIDTVSDLDFTIVRPITTNTAATTTDTDSQQQQEEEHEVGSDRTCSSIEEQFEESPVCDFLDNCCPYCIEQYEAVVECSINTARAFRRRRRFREQQMQMMMNGGGGSNSATTTTSGNEVDWKCNLECGGGDNEMFQRPQNGNNGTNIQQRPQNGNNGSNSRRPQNGNNNNNNNRFLQQDGRIMIEINLEEEIDDAITLSDTVLSKLEQCRQELADNIAFDLSDTGVDAYMNCLLRTTLQNDAADPTTAPPSDVPTTSSSPSSMKGSSMMLLPMMIMIIRGNI